jgi:hypothetical protein
VGYAGQFKPVGGANPTIGTTGTVEYVEEDRVEVLVNDKGENTELKNVIEELKKVRPSRNVELWVIFLNTQLVVCRLRSIHTKKLDTMFTGLKMFEYPTNFRGQGRPYPHVDSLSSLRMIAMYD